MHPRGHFHPNFNPKGILSPKTNTNWDLARPADPLSSLSKIYFGSDQKTLPGLVCALQLINFKSQHMTQNYSYFFLILTTL